MYASKSDEFLTFFQFKSGNDSAFDVLMVSLLQIPKCLSYVMQLVKDYDLANDIFQEVFIKVVGQLVKKSLTTTKK